MSEAGEAIRKHHRQLEEKLHRTLAKLQQMRSDEDADALAEFLRSDLLEHARGEEAALYPAVEPLIKEHGTATATMSVDHEFIEKRIRRIEAVVNDLHRAKEAERPALWDQLRQELLRLAAIVEVHLQKEERIYLPLFEQYLSEEDQRRVLHGMHQQHTPEQVSQEGEASLDVRDLPPAERHPLIFRTFEALEPGQTFILVNDHDPKPLYYQFAFERKGQFTWEPVESGPKVWRVRIGKKG